MQETPQEESVPPNAGSEPAGSGSLVPNLKRDVRRLSIRAIKNALEQSTGYVWIVNGESPFVTHADVLGVPNYSETTEESMAPSVMFFKTLINAANVSCAALVENEPSTSNEESRPLFSQKRRKYSF